MNVIVEFDDHEYYSYMYRTLKSYQAAYLYEIFIQKAEQSRYVVQLKTIFSNPSLKAAPTLFCPCCIGSEWLSFEVSLRYLDVSG